MCILLFLHPFLFETFLSKLPSLGTFLCLEVDVHSHVFLLASFSPGIPFLLNFQVLLRTTKLAQRNSKYYLVLRSLHPSTTSYYEACTQYSKYYFSYYKACAKRFRVLLRRRLAQIASRYYLVLQNLQKSLSGY